MLSIAETGVKNPVRVRARREALVRAAIDTFSERGYHASRVADVAAAAGFSQGTVYNYVKSKEELLYLICEDHALGFERILTERVEGVAEPRLKLEALLDAVVEGVFSYRKHYLVMLRELHNVERSRRKVYMELTSRQRQICQGILCDIAQHEPLIVPDPLLTTNILLYLPKLIVSRGWDLKGKVKDDKVAEEIKSFMRRGLGVAPTEASTRAGDRLRPA